MHRAILIAFALLGCGASNTPSPTSSSASSAASSSGACWPIVALTFEVLEHGKEWEPLLRLHADGTIENVKRGPYTKLANDRVPLKEGELACDGARKVSLAGMGGGYYDANDVLIVDPIRISVLDDGTVEAKSSRKALRARVVGNYAAAKRTAALLTFLAIAGP